MNVVPTKYSEVLPEGSLTPPPKMVEDVLWTCGVEGRVCAVDAIPPLRTVFPRSQPPTLAIIHEIL